ncbi:ribosome silencing factor [Halioxenophilus sp. WMMB6]|uniref:ribosome silencing factor n=1 Tax=Halioxenophilus sp. WMMB6 TaxID=3073815 RepID=UPI00295EB7DC|nr:ribosome silencing factor [Halioxenophilus sp. WMMB6]
MTELEQIVINALEDLKAKDIVEIDVANLTEIMDKLVIASGTSSRHVKSLAQNVASEAKAAGFMPLGMEGETQGEWVLVDFGDIVVHVMTPATRSFYDLEKLWSEAPRTRLNQTDEP